MKSSDIAMLVLIASISVMFAFGIVSAIPGLKLSDEPVKVKTIEAYSATVDEPDPTVFNREAENPTVDVTIGGNSDAGQ